MAKAKRVPLYVQAYQELRSEILQGIHKPGAALPSENELCRRYKTSRRTARNSLRRLQLDGLIRNEPGIGWRVMSSDAVPRLTTKPAALAVRSAGWAPQLTGEVRRVLEAAGIDVRLFLLD